MFTPSIGFISDRKQLDRAFFLKAKLPTMVMDGVSRLPFIGSPALQKNVRMLKTAYGKIEDLYNLFNHFTRNDWIYETRAILDLEAQMTEGERKEFFIDPKTFSWNDVVALYIFGFQKFMWREDVFELEDNSFLLLKKIHCNRYFDTVRNVFFDMEIKTRDIVQLRKFTIKSQLVGD